MCESRSQGLKAAKVAAKKAEEDAAKAELQNFQSTFGADSDDDDPAPPPRRAVAKGPVPTKSRPPVPAAFSADASEQPAVRGFSILYAATSKPSRTPRCGIHRTEEIISDIIVFIFCVCFYFDANPLEQAQPPPTNKGRRGTSNLDALMADIKAKQQMRDDYERHKARGGEIDPELEVSRLGGPDLPGKHERCSPLRSSDPSFNVKNHQQGGSLRLHDAHRAC